MHIASTTFAKKSPSPLSSTALILNGWYTETKNIKNTGTKSAYHNSVDTFVNMAGILSILMEQSNRVTNIAIIKNSSRFYAIRHTIGELVNVLSHLSPKNHQQ